MKRQSSAPRLSYRDRSTTALMLPSDIESSPTDSSRSLCNVKAASIPITVEVKSKAQLEPQVSAPSYFASLKENEAPPFKLEPVHQKRPVIVTGTIMTDDDVVSMVAASVDDPQHGLRKFLEKFLLEKKIIQNTALLEKKFLVSLLTTTVDYAAQRDFSAHKLAVLLTVYLRSHIYFTRYYWTAPRSLWDYFVDLMIRHTLVNFPDGEEVFAPDECYDIVTHFHTIYVSHLPLIHILVFGAYRLKFLWPFIKK